MVSLNCYELVCWPKDTRGLCLARVRTPLGSSNGARLRSTGPCIYLREPPLAPDGLASPRELVEYIICHLKAEREYQNSPYPHRLPSATRATTITPRADTIQVHVALTIAHPYDCSSTHDALPLMIEVSSA